MFGCIGYGHSSAWIAINVSTITVVADPISIAGACALTGIGEERHEGEDDDGEQDEDEPDRRGDDAFRAAEPIAPGLLAAW